MPSPKRADLENAARSFFAEMAKELSQPRDFHPVFRNEDIAFSADMSRARIRELDGQLQDNRFDGVVEHRARRISDECGSDWSELTAPQQHYALQLSAKAEREQMEMLIHGLEQPGKAFIPADDLFGMSGAASAQKSSPAPRPHSRTPAGRSKSYPTLAMAIEDFTDGMRKRKLGASQIDEVGRILNWLTQVIGPSTPMDDITTDELRTFRNDIERMDRDRQGRASPFLQRLTDVPERQISSATAQKYWAGVQQLFAYAEAEGQAPSNPAKLLKIKTKKGETSRKPEPFSADELKRLYSTPLYTGYQSSSRLTAAGNCRERGQHWWAGVLPLFTGLRAGELSQLLPSDFVFQHDIPHVLVQQVNGHGQRTKSTKNVASIRAVPLSPTLLDLGIRQFVERRQKIEPKARVFEHFRLGGPGKLSEGMARFWGDYLRKFGLHKPGRATHVMRHSLVQFLRANEVAGEDIAAVVGHSQGTQTGEYGASDYPLPRKFKTICKLDFGFDVKAALGGDYVDTQHEV